jgi:pimeloyl-ACP methyl ester carboxylesterase
MQVKVGDILLEVDRHGSYDDPAVILIAGLGFQLIDWPTGFCDQLVAAGFQVIRFDNRDIGLSHKFEEAGIPDLATVMSARMSGADPVVPYQLTDMAADVIGLMDALGLPQAHIVGMSMGGMISQILAASYPDRVSSLTSIMSSSSDPSLPGPAPAAAAILSSAPLSQEMVEIVDFGLRVNEVIGSLSFRWDKADLTAHIAACVERSYCPQGYMRQYAAVMAATSRRKLLSKVTGPSLVIHGENDPLVQPVCGRDVADHIKDARFELVPGMGHDLSPALCDHLAGLIAPHIQGAEQSK